MPCARRRSPLRKALARCTWEGATAELVGACCGGAALTGWALHFGMRTELVAAVSALPIVAQTVQLPAALVTTRFGHRRTVLVAMGLSRSAFLPLLVLGPGSFGQAGVRALLVVCAVLHHSLGVVASNAWSDWMGEMVPRSLRGRYCGPRAALAATAGSAAAFIAGGALGQRDPGAMGPVLHALALVAAVAGAASVLGASSPGVWPTARREPGARLRDLVAPFRDWRFRGVIAYTLAWYAACGLSAPFFALYLLRDLRFGLALLAVQGAGFALARTASSRTWGRAVDAWSARRVLVVCTAGLALSPLCWIACSPDRLWPLAVETVVGGVLFGGYSVASVTLPLSVAPSRGRAFHLGAVATAGGLAFALTSSAGVGLLAYGHASLRALLAISAALRVVTVAVALALPKVARSAPNPSAGRPPLGPRCGGEQPMPQRAHVSLRVSTRL